MKPVYLVNLRPGEMDISIVQDVDGIPVSLKAAGKPGYYRKCPAEAGDHPDVLRLEKAGWLDVLSHPPDADDRADEEAAQKAAEEAAAKKAAEEAAAAEAAKKAAEEAEAAEAAKKAEEEAEAAKGAAEEAAAAEKPAEEAHAAAEEPAHE